MIILKMLKNYALSKWLKKLKIWKIKNITSSVWQKNAQRDCLGFIIVQLCCVTFEKNNKGINI